METAPSLDTFLRSLLTVNGVGLAYGVLLSLLLSVWPEYQALAARTKRLFFMGVCLVLPVGAALLGHFLLHWETAWDALIFAALSAGFTAIVSGTALNAKELSKDGAPLMSLVRRSKG